ncbi:similar to Saccharomyces cerevisiae YBR037C SCO1 Copper-binding protein of the mitochondrial inner membrane, required for cytochrome c oxidase activity and respiration [Maudiozyma saulgeensis]|uniref:Similar to Saccharomyces cerevisiae YBR037C SCO1 Copper-binding protein of the mitochondrial inner membrane, required for cytochrome c oxidase activity and respiration n=1 Tax=Maudiozyma saulgeensis TaxID=1789683 RepID=A0A1X7R752_9SACH|nr:similar to Saccharomyces cerevisiae YBR037C SCO1 Copper-binding protein of the mitochondrial inner membrane, required for cytochrome c oxidase activity and respiration [Kazachstania saulgeensis]
MLKFSKSQSTVAHNVLVATRFNSTKLLMRSRIVAPSFQHLRTLHNTSAIYQKSHLSRQPIGGSESQRHGSKTSRRFENVEFNAPLSIAFFLIVGGLSYYIFENQKKKMDAEQQKESRKGYGTPQIGGQPFELIDQDGRAFTDKDMLGKFSIVYFGFSHCPDICPDELDKLGCWLDELQKDRIELQPVFVTCDPARDSPEVLKEYLKDFHNSIIGITGTYAQIKQMCKQYRVYFSTPENVKPGQEYLVDHSIFFYLMDPEGKFITILGRNLDEVSGAEKIRESIWEYKRTH